MAVYTVDTTADTVDARDGVLSLREALAQADAAAGADTIRFADAVQGGTIVLAGSQLTVASEATIDGGSGLTIDADGRSRVLLVQEPEGDQPVTVTLSHLTITGGRIREGQGGAGISDASEYSGYASSLNLDHVAVTGNRGGGIDGFYNVNLINSTVSANKGGGIDGRYVSLARSTVNDNEGRGIHGYRGVYLHDSTVSGNHTTGGVGGLESNGWIFVENSTISGNTGGGIETYPSHLIVRNSIVVGNYDANGVAADVIGDIVDSNGHNIFGSEVEGAAASDLTNVPANLLFAAINPTTGGGLLADNGGPTQTIALRNAPDNSALGGADPGDSPVTDQRGEARPAPHGTDPDIGAFESAWVASAPAKGFNGLEYIATYPDLIRALGPQEAAGTAHYLRYGAAEGRAVGFDGLAYIASYADLTLAMGADRDAGATHFIAYGYTEGRTVAFHPLDYIASYMDLMAAFGANPDAGSSHFIAYGAAEGRHVAFDGLEYIASYDDLIHALGADRDAGGTHFIAYGESEGRHETFDGLQYVASYDDLITALGPNRDAGSTHFITYGSAENRPPDQFDEVQYLANYADLQAAFGDDTEAATIHYIRYGHAEGRRDEPLGTEAVVDFLL